MTPPSSAFGLGLPLGPFIPSAVKINENNSSNNRIIYEEANVLPEMG
jgi:hypothetical protein